MHGGGFFYAMKVLREIVLALVISAGSLVAGDEGLRVVALHPILADWAQQVGGERVEVFSLVPPGVDPHFFEPTPQDLRRMSESDLLLAIGLGYETYLPKLKDAVGSRIQLVSLGEVLPNLVHGACEHADHDEEHHHHSDWDPHWWHGLEQAEAAVEVLRERFTAADPEGGALYREQAAKYLEDLGELRRWAALEIAALPRARRVLVLSHDSLAYFARDFHFEVFPVAGISPEDQPGARQLRQLIDEIRTRRIPAVFVGNMENPRVLQELTRETGATSGGVLFMDGLAEGEAASYLGMYRHNVSTIVRALQ
jgi:zinc/manganese transport system substrate-binding protein